MLYHKVANLQFLPVSFEYFNQRQEAQTNSIKEKFKT